MKTITASSLFLISLFFEAVGAQAKIADRIALYGQSKYASDFKAVDYVNPEAPQGGKIILPAYGTFDNLRAWRPVLCRH